jgi:RNA 2',3'-cyclic 3'-phosphodiesterase
VSERLFFALWPDDAARRRIAEDISPTLQAGKAQRPDQWHVTVVFLGDIEAHRKPAVLACAGRAQVPAFTLRFDAVEYWRRARVVCLTASVTPAPLAELAARLRAALQESNFPLDTRPLRPHVTLARKVNSAPARAGTQPIAWPVDRFTLVRSVTDPAGSRYEPLHWWNLRAETR